VSCFRYLFKPSEDIVKRSTILLAGACKMRCRLMPLDRRMIWGRSKVGAFTTGLDALRGQALMGRRAASPLDENDRTLRPFPWEASMQSPCTHTHSHRSRGFFSIHLITFKMPPASAANSAIFPTSLSFSACAFHTSQLCTTAKSVLDLPCCSPYISTTNRTIAPVHMP
jgi:hypothetical protein